MTDVLEDIVLDVDLTLEPGCESPRHVIIWWQHDEGPATHVVRGPCPHIHGLRCALWISRAMSMGIWCPDCEIEARPWEINCIEL